MDPLRRSIAALLFLGFGGLTVELLLLGHVEDWWQRVPLVANGLAAGALGWQIVRPTRSSVRVLRGVMAALVAVAAIGVVLHYRGNLAFQMDIDPAQRGWPLFLKIMHAKAPPALAPAAMAQLGLLGLVYTVRHPALGGGTPAQEVAS
jgi:hypothetical protein